MKNVSEINLGVPGQVVAIVVMMVMMEVVEHSLLMIAKNMSEINLGVPGHVVAIMVMVVEHSLQC